MDYKVLRTPNSQKEVIDYVSQFSKIAFPKNVSFDTFLAMIENEKKTSYLSHVPIYLGFYMPWDATTYSEVEKYMQASDSKVSDPVYDKSHYEDGERQYSTAYITTTLETMVMNGWLKDLDKLDTYFGWQFKRSTVKLTTTSQMILDMMNHWSILKKFAITMIQPQKEKDSTIYVDNIELMMSAFDNDWEDLMNATKNKELKKMINTFIYE